MDPIGRPIGSPIGSISFIMNHIFYYEMKNNINNEIHRKPGALAAVIRGVQRVSGQHQTTVVV